MIVSLPEGARQELQSATVSRGFEVALEVEETGSGAKSDRSGLPRVLSAARWGKVDAVLVWKLDHFGRSSLDLLSNIRALEDTGVRFIATSQGIDIKPGGDAMSRLLLTMLAGVAEFERDLIRERTRLGLQNATPKGKRVGRPLPLSSRQARQAARLRDAGSIWAEVAELLGCSLGAACGTVARLAEKGTRESAS